MRRLIGQNINWAKPECPIEKVVMKIKNIPSYMGCVDAASSNETDYVSDLLFGVCPYTGTIQSLNRLPLDKVYINPHNTCVGKVWESHNAAFAEFIMRQIRKDLVVCEIGGGDGNIASRCVEYVKEWHCIDPNVPENHFVHPKLVYHNEWYQPRIPIIHRADVVVHSNFLEHVRFPIEFFNNMYAPLQLFSVPNFRQGMLVGNPSMLNFEHEQTLTENVLDELLDSSGYLSSFVYYNDFTLFYRAQRVGSSREMASFNYNDSLDLLLRYEFGLRNQAVTLENKARDILRTDNFLVFFFGAHIFYTILRSCGLTTEFTGIIDNSPIKIGKRLYGTNYIVEHPNIIKNVINPVVVVPRTPYQFEMIEQVKNLNNSSHIISMEDTHVVN